MTLRMLQLCLIAAAAAAIAAWYFVGSVHVHRAESGVDCARVRAGVGHVSPWESEACR